MTSDLDKRLVMVRDAFAGLEEGKGDSGAQEVLTDYVRDQLLKHPTFLGAMLKQYGWLEFVGDEARQLVGVYKKKGSVSIDLDAITKHIETLSGIIDKDPTKDEPPLVAICDLASWRTMVDAIYSWVTLWNRDRNLAEKEDTTSYTPRHKLRQLGYLECGECHYLQGPPVGHEEGEEYRCEDCGHMGKTYVPEPVTLTAGDGMDVVADGIDVVTGEVLEPGQTITATYEYPGDVGVVDPNGAEMVEGLLTEVAPSTNPGGAEMVESPEELDPELRVGEPGGGIEGSGPPWGWNDEDYF